MTTEEQISRSQDERDEARQNLRGTLAEFNAKVERARGDLRPEHLVERHPIAASLVASASGLLIGSINNHRTGPLMIAAVTAIAVSIRYAREASGRKSGDSTE